MEKKVVYYSEFGAIGDGKADDFPAIRACHEYANENGLKVMTDAGKTYYVGNLEGNPAIVKTDVDFQDATFILDDTVVPTAHEIRTTGVFRLLGDYDAKIYDKDSEIVKALNASGGFLASDMKNIGYAPGYPALLIVHDDEHSAYLRWGTHATGRPNPQLEIAVVDKDGNVDPDTPFLLDFHGVTYIEEYRIDDKPIVVEGGKFITVANNAPPEYTYYNRGFNISRSNVTIKNVVHEITGEGPHGAPYQGFISCNVAYNVRCENLSLMSHLAYMDYQYNERGDVKKVNSIMGSYDISIRCSSHIYFKNCIQTNFFKWEEKRIVYHEFERWGIMGSNYSKNFTYDGCTLSRIDAHAGVYNVTVKNSKITYIKLIGGGKALIENTEIYAPEGQNAALIELRPDYGSTWRGDIIIKDCEFINWKDKEAYIASAVWNNWPFGYTTYLPNITVDNLKIDKKCPVYIFGFNKLDASLNIDEKILANGEENKNPMRIDATARIKNTDGEFFAANNARVNEKMTLIIE